LSQRTADALLVLIAVIWGSTFAVVHASVDAFPALALIALRFGCASAVFIPAVMREKAALSRSVLGVGALLGMLLFIGFTTQTVGLQYTTPARAGFITGLNVVLVPLLGRIWGERPPRRALIGVVIAVLGLLMLSWGCYLPGFTCASTGDAAPQQWLGDILVLLCSVAFAMHIVAVGRWAIRLPVIVVNTVQLLVVTILAGLTSLLVSWPPSVPDRDVWVSAIYLGLVATALVFALQLKLQRYTTSTHTALIFALEPVFAALFSWLWIGEVITGAILVGGALMLVGVMVAEVGWPNRRGMLRRRLTGQSVALDGDA
jgi:drug/metabolite transporter (DMT)-like permease